MGSLGTEPQQAVVSWFSSLIARSCMHHICVFWRWQKTWKLERSNRVLKRKLRATHRELRRVPRKTGDGACRYSGSVTVGVERIGSDGKPEVFSLFRARPSSRKFPRFNNMCITSVLLYQYRHCRRPPREKRKKRDYDHSTRTLILTLIETLWGDQYLDSVACEGSRSIRPIWLLCSGRLEVDSAGSGCCGFRNPRTIGTTAV